jgi:hypothetical protein
MHRNTALIFVSVTALGALHGSADAQNVVINGDFEAGNTGFSTAYSFAPGGNSTEGQYTIRANPAGWNGSFQSTGDHTSGTGLMMVVNGQNLTTPILMWGQTVNTVPGRRYTFSMWVRAVVNGPSAILLATINGTDLTPGYVAPQQFGDGWTGFTREWIADAATASISIKNLNIATFPNDFVIDDIALVGADCLADLNTDGLVDDADFVIFVVAYDILDCTDAAMPAGCPADLNADGVVDDLDFQLFAVAYNELLCP